MDKAERFSEDPKRSLYKLTWPILIGTLVQILYNITDTAFVGRLGADSIAALTFSFPLMFVMIGINAGVAIGTASRIARFIGEKKTRGAENAAMHGLIISTMLGVIAAVIGLFLLKPIFLLLGATGTVLALSIGYMKIIMLGILFMFVTFTMSNIFTSQGDTKTPMKVQIVGLTANIILDPIFIYTLGYGVAGAAIATFISFVSGFVMFSYYIKKRSELQIRKESFTYNNHIIKQIMRVGMPASITLILLAFYTMFINRLLAIFGSDYVAAFGLAWRLEGFITMPVFALGTSLLTLSGMFYGAKKHEVLKKTIKTAVKTGVIFAITLGVIIFLFPKIFIRIFTTEKLLLELAANYIRVWVFAMPFMAISMLLSRAMEGMGYGMPSMIVNLSRGMMTAIPLGYIFVLHFGYGYLTIALAMVIGSIIGAGTATIWLKKIIHHTQQYHS